MSAGFDAARGDNLGQCDVTPEGYAHMTHMLSVLASGKLVIALEVRASFMPVSRKLPYWYRYLKGGYNIEAVANSALACVKVLLGEVPHVMQSMTASAAATTTLHLVAAQQSQFWKSIRPTFASKDGMLLCKVDSILADSERPQTWRLLEKLYQLPVIGRNAQLGRKSRC